MFKYKNTVAFEEKKDKLFKSIRGVSQYTTDSKTVTLISELDNETLKHFEISLRSGKEIESFDDVGQVAIKVRDEEMARGEMNFYVNPGNELYEVVINLPTMEIQRDYTNSLDDIIIRKKIFVDGTAALNIAGVTLWGTDVLQIELYDMQPDSFRNFHVFRQLYEALEIMSTKKESACEEITGEALKRVRPSDNN